MKEKLSPQKDYLLSFLWDNKWHCASEWADRVKDDRTRFCELESYMTSKGYTIASEPCRGTACGRSKCPLNKRRAEKLTTSLPGSPQWIKEVQDFGKELWDSCAPASV